MLRVSALHYSTGSQDSEGVWTAALVHALHQPTIMHPGISIVSIWKFVNQSLGVQSDVRMTKGQVNNQNNN